MTQALYPLGLRLAGRQVVVIGAGKVATRRVAGLVEVAARVTVIAPEASVEITKRAAAGEVTWLARRYQAGDLAGAWLVHTATGDPLVDEQVTREGEEQGTIVVNAADAESSAAWVPALLRKSGATYAVFGNGQPRLASKLRDRLAAWLVETGSLATGATSLANSAALDWPGTQSGLGCVALVGGGPGDPGLITIAGSRQLQRAQVVVFDRLAPIELLANLPAEVELIDVGKSPDCHPVPQDTINQILVDRARAGLRVVRLKGGDPFVFGRGSEELAHCAAQGVPTITVPGVSSALAAPAIAGIPLTHRGLATGFTVLTGHEPIAQIPIPAVHTVVVLMGVATFAKSATNLITAGLRRDTPVAIIERAYAPDQRVTFCDLAGASVGFGDFGIKAPAVIVIGDVVRLASEGVAGEIGEEEQ